MNFSLMRRDRDPFFEQFLSLRRGLDDLWRNVAPLDLFQGTPAALQPPVETFLKDGMFKLKLQIPGVDPKDVSVQVQGDQLVIKGESKHKEETKDATYLHKEFSYGAFERVMTLPADVKAEALTASYRDGVLELSAPVAAKALPRSVEIKAEAPKAEKKAA